MKKKQEQPRKDLLKAYLMEPITNIESWTHLPKTNLVEACDQHSLDIHQKENWVHLCLLFIIWYDTLSFCISQTMQKMPNTQFRKIGLLWLHLCLAYSPLWQNLAKERTVRETMRVRDKDSLWAVDQAVPTWAFRGYSSLNPNISHTQLS